MANERCPHCDCPAIDGRESYTHTVADLQTRLTTAERRLEVAVKALVRYSRRCDRCDDVDWQHEDGACAAVTCGCEGFMNIAQAALTEIRGEEEKG